MEIQVSNDAKNFEWNTFVDSVEGSHYTQGGLWAQVREVQGWRSYSVCIMDNRVILAGAQILIRPLKYFHWAGYVPHGLLNPGRDLEIEEKLILAIQEVCRRNRIMYMAIPYWSGKSNEYLDLEYFGFKRSLMGDIDLPCTNYVDLTPEPERIIETMGRNKRNQVRASQKRNLVFREGIRSEIEDFYRLHQIDSQRIGYIPFSIDFFYRLWDIYYHRGLTKLFLTELDGKIINAAIFIAHRDTFVAYKIGWSGEESNRYPNEAIHWGAMLWAKTHGYRTYDFGGFETWVIETALKGKPYSKEFQHSYAYFKYQMSNTLEIFPPLYDYLPNPLLGWSYRTFVPLLHKSGEFRKIKRIIKNSSIITTTKRNPDE